jgi:hypothetical protein
LHGDTGGQGRTDMTKLRDAFRNVAKASKNFLQQLAIEVRYFSSLPSHYSKNYGTDPYSHVYCCRTEHRFIIVLVFTQSLPTTAQHLPFIIQPGRMISTDLYTASFCQKLQGKERYAV